MAPEQARGEEADVRSDIFSAGALLYHLLTGHRPFRGANAAEVLAAVLRDDPAPAAGLCPGCPPQLSRLLDRCLAKNPEARPASAAILREELATAHRQMEAADTAQQTVAVLPFADLSPARDQEHFCTGIAEEIINALTGLPGLKVVSRMTSFQFREMGGDSRDMGRQLGVTALLDGSVRMAGDRMRLIAQLIDVQDGCHIWSQRFDREIGDIFQVQDEIAQSIVKALQVAMGSEPPRRLVDVRTLDPAAYDVYLRGRDFFRRWGKRNIEIAQRMFMQAVELDPDYAAAHAGLADTYSYLYMYIDSSAENLERADAASARALEIDPVLADAHAARGLALSLKRHFDAADRSFRTASELDPNLFEAYYFAARNCVVQGAHTRAVAYYERAAEVSPADYQIPILTAQIHQALGQEEEARQANRHGMELAEKAILANPEDARACYMGAGAMIRLGQKERGLKWARRALALDPDDPAILYNVACNLAGLGEIDEAIACLERTVKVGAAYRDWMLNDTDLDPLRDHPRFRELLDSLA
jgi:TolB-like protein/Tfp pilus assembly protein PilF